VTSIILSGQWSFFIGFTPKEGIVIHDIRYDDRLVFHRLSMSEMTVPYGDPRAPYHRKQAFDFGDCGAGITANELRCVSPLNSRADLPASDAIA
jgi:primary-amine oxidase